MPHAPTPGRPRKLTIRRIREICLPKVFKVGNQIYGWGVVTNPDLKQDGTLTGMMTEDLRYLYELWSTSSWEMDEPTSDRVHRVTISLQTGKWHCTCAYARVDVCSHVVAVLIYAAKNLDATVPAGDLPIRRRTGRPSLVPYRDETLRILAEADSAESADKKLNKLLELATACRMEGDTTEALMVHLGLTEALLYGLDYQAHSEDFETVLNFYTGWLAEYVPESDDMDKMRIYKFGVSVRRMKNLMYRRLEREPKILCLTAMHRMFILTNPWRPSGVYLYPLISVPRAAKYYEFMRRLHDPLVPAHTPDWRENPVEFQATLNLAYYQSVLYQKLKDPSLLDFYKKHYRDDIGTCIRYGQYLSYRRGKGTPTTKDLCRRLFPDDNPWDSDSSDRPPGIT